MRQEDLCPGKANAIWIKIGPVLVWDPHPERPKAKRIRMKCQLCGRKLLSSVQVNHDGDYLIHSIPKHKPRFWWKRRKHG